MGVLHYAGAGFGIAALGILYQYDILGTFVFVLIHFLIAGVGIYLGVSWSLVQGKIYKPSAQLKEPKLAQELLKIMEKITEKKPEIKKVVITRNIDGILQEVMELVVRDHILSWYSDLSREQEAFVNAVKCDMWKMIEAFTNRLSRIDKVKFITDDLMEKLYTHFKEVREYKKREEDNITKKFILQPWLESDETEKDFLRKVCEVLLIVLLPEEYSKCVTIRRLLREVLTSSVLKPTVDLICDPDYINQKLISYIDYRRQVSEDTRKTYIYAANYEEFVRLIDKCDDIEHLKQMRYNIMTEIIHATTIENIKKEQKVSSEKMGKSGDKTQSRVTGKGDLLKARNLKRYINQLTIAKAHSERRIHALGGPDYKDYDTTEDEDNMVPQGHKVLSFEEVMDSQEVRAEFMKFLERDDNHSLLGFYIAVEKLMISDKRKQHQLGKEIFDKYIASSTSAVKLDKVVVKGMEAFVLGNMGPEAFENGQEIICKLLKKQYYPSFVVSDVYHRYSVSLEQDNASGKVDTPQDNVLFDAGSDEEEYYLTHDDSDIFKNQSYIAQQKLEQLDEKIRNKSQALKALKESRKQEDVKTEKVERDMESEHEQLLLERRQLEVHILRTQKWCENQGDWRAAVYEAQLVEEGDKKTKIPMFVLIVHLAGREKSHNLQHSAEGWLITRTIPEFYVLHQKLIEIGPWLKKKDLPSVRRFTTYDDKFLQESKKLLNEYLSAVMKDAVMAQSEALYGFLTPTPEFFTPRKPEKKKGFFITALFKSLPIIQDKQVSTTSELKLVEDEDDGSKPDQKDSIAEPFYKLVNEVFECRGMFKWLRRSFITFVEVTFGRSINRQLRETVDWMFSESMIIYYITLFKNSMWPNGVLAQPLPPKSDEEKLQTRMEAKEKFLSNMPDAVRTLLGEENGRRGAIKLFEVLQDSRLNKHLFYIILELLLLEICPELEDEI